MIHFLRGIKGDKGDKGFKGEHGKIPEPLYINRGFKGDVGFPGQPGPKGLKGNLLYEYILIIRNIKCLIISQVKWENWALKDMRD